MAFPVKEKVKEGQLLSSLRKTAQGVGGVAKRTSFGSVMKRLFCTAGYLGAVSPSTRTVDYFHLARPDHSITASEQIAVNTGFNLARELDRPIPGLDFEAAFGATTGALQAADVMLDSGADRPLVGWQQLSETEREAVVQLEN